MTYINEQDRTFNYITRMSDKLKLCKYFCEITGDETKLPDKVLNQRSMQSSRADAKCKQERNKL